MPGWIGPWDIVVLLVLALLVFGPKRLPEIGRSLGGGMREFKDSVTGRDAGNQVSAELPRASDAVAGEPEGDRKPAAAARR